MTDGAVVFFLAKIRSSFFKALINVIHSFYTKTLATIMIVLYMVSQQGGKEAVALNWLYLLKFCVTSFQFWKRIIGVQLIPVAFYRP